MGHHRSLEISQMAPVQSIKYFFESFWIPSQLRTDDPFNRQIIPASRLSQVTRASISGNPWQTKNGRKFSEKKTHHLCKQKFKNFNRILRCES